MRGSLWIAITAAAIFVLLSLNVVTAALFSTLDPLTNEWVAGTQASTQVAWNVAADVLVYGIAPLLCVVVVWQTIRWRDSGKGAGIALLLLGMAANDTILKPLFGRLRPPTAWSDSFAFPSGHTTAALLVASTILVTGCSRIRVALVAGITLLTALARILSGAHWVSDVVGSMAYGTAVAALVLGNRRVSAPASSAMQA